MDPGVEKRGADVVMLDLLEDQVRSIVAAAPLVGNPSVEGGGIKNIRRLRQMGEPSTNHFCGMRQANRNASYDFINSSVL